jgi:hypothetical protein
MTPCLPPKLLALPYFLESARGLELIGFLFWIWMIYECATRERHSTEKILWLLLVVLAPVLGSLIYFLVRVVKIQR